LTEPAGHRLRARDLRTAGTSDAAALILKLLLRLPVLQLARSAVSEGLVRRRSLLLLLQLLLLLNELLLLLVVGVLLLLLLLLLVGKLLLLLLLLLPVHLRLLALKRLLLLLLLLLLVVENDVRLKREEQLVDGGEALGARVAEVDLPSVWRLRHGGVNDALNSGSKEENGNSIRVLRGEVGVCVCVLCALCV
jgi:hypothetical protein